MKSRHIKKKDLVNYFYEEAASERSTLNILLTTLTVFAAVMFCGLTAAPFGVGLAACFGAGLASYSLNRFIGGISSAYKAKRVNLNEIGRSIKDIFFLGHDYDSSNSDLHTYNPSTEKLKFINEQKNGKTVKHAYAEQMTEAEKKHYQEQQARNSRINGEIKEAARGIAHVNKYRGHRSRAITIYS
ncbi:MAG: hypothetical protein J0G32_01110 [Alphaproteobacteria bacterium]|nr:hypothetical protein [Alphaproteobacteria bacterium]OJV13217.1 MAG: hypothetical protein BGO27_00230 [Alphaproteobacteria bacterium 33-17]